MHVKRGEGGEREKRESMCACMRRGRRGGGDRVRMQAGRGLARKSMHPCTQRRRGGTGGGGGDEACTHAVSKEGTQKSMSTHKRRGPGSGEKASAHGRKEREWRGETREHTWIHSVGGRVREYMARYAEKVGGREGGGGGGGRKRMHACRT